MMRDGVVPEEAPKERTRVSAKKIEPVEVRPSVETQISPEAERYVEEQADSLLRGVKKTTVVQVPGGSTLMMKKQAPKEVEKPTEKVTTPGEE